SEEELIISKINHKLALQCGAEFKIQFFAGDDLYGIPDDTLISMADCYAQVFNESWGESWTRDSALEEIKSCINCPDDYVPVMSLLFKGKSVVGFSWGFIMDTDCLN